MIRTTSAAHVLTGQMRPSGVRCCVIVASFSPFFWFSNVMATHSASCGGGHVDECGMACMKPASFLSKNLTFSIVSSFVRFVSPPMVVEYSHDRMAKNRAPTISWPMASFCFVLTSAATAFQTTRGRHAWCWVGGSTLV